MAPQFKWDRIDYSNPLFNSTPVEKTWGNGFGLFGQSNTYTPSQEWLSNLQNSGLSQDAINLLSTKEGFNNAISSGAIKIGEDGSLMTTPIFDKAMANYQNGVTSNIDFNGSTGIFGKGMDGNGNTTWGGATGFQWASAGLGAMNALYGMYMGNKQMKLAKENFEEQKRLSHANYQMQAKAYNNNLRNQQSGRSFSGMSGAAQRTLGSEYRTRRAKDDY